MIQHKLRSVRKRLGFSQRIVATACYMTQSSYSRKESGLVKIYDIEWERLAKFFNVKVKEIKGTPLRQEEPRPYADKSSVKMETLERLISVSQEIMEENKRLKEELNKSKGKELG